MNNAVVTVWQLEEAFVDQKKQEALQRQEEEKRKERERLDEMKRREQERILEVRRSAMFSSFSKICGRTEPVSELPWAEISELNDSWLILFVEFGKKHSVTWLWHCGMQYSLI